MDYHQTHFVEYCQRRLAAEEHPHIVVAWEPCLGCSAANGVLAVELAKQKPDIQIAYVISSPRAGPSQIHRIFSIARRRCAQAILHVQTSNIKFQNGSRIDCYNLRDLQATRASHDLVIIDQLYLRLDHARHTLGPLPRSIVFNVDLDLAKHADIEYSTRTLMRGDLLPILCHACKQHQTPCDIAIHVVRYFL